MIEASVSRRYARALFSLAVEEGKHERVGEELEAVAQAIRASGEARTVLENPGYTPAQRHALADVLAKSLSLSPLVANFLRLLVDRHRLTEIPVIARSFAEMVDEKVGRVRTCTIEPRALSQAEQWINARRIEWEHRLDRLDEYLKILGTEGDDDGSGD